MSGPLPAPNLLEEYERISPGAASIIISEFQLQAQHRRTQESRIVMSDIIRAYIGQGIGCALAAYLIWTGGDLLRHGQSITGFQSIGLAIATGAVPFAIKAYSTKNAKTKQTQSPLNNSPEINGGLKARIPPEVIVSNYFVEHLQTLKQIAENTKADWYRHILTAA